MLVPLIIFREYFVSFRKLILHLVIFLVRIFLLLSLHLMEIFKFPLLKMVIDLSTLKLRKVSRLI
nr:MAG TPA: hypothetical protein [Caudoviricetes sp.]